MSPDPAQGPTPALLGLSEPGAFTRLHRERVVDVGAAFSAAATFGYGVFYLVGNAMPIFTANLLACLGFLSVSLARHARVEIRLYAGVTVGLLLFGVQLVLVGGINNGITPWLLLPSIVAVIIGERRLAVYSTIIAVAEPSLVVLGSHLGLLGPAVTLPLPDGLMLLSILGVATICAAFAYVSNATRDQLQREVDARTLALSRALGAAQSAREEAVRAAEAKDAFFANLTHEIRTPLTGIAGSAELLAETELTGEQRTLADGLLASTRNLTALVNAMLDHARLAAGHASPDVAPVAPANLARDLASLFRTRAEDARIALDITVAPGVPPLVETDGIRLGQVLANLVANALKFTSQGGVRVEIAWEPEEDGHRGTLVAAVSDTGPGIAPDLTDAVFQPFVQGDASIRRAHGGTGLGLAISRQLALLLGGTIDLTSVVGEGSTFTVRVPVTVVAPAVAQSGGPDAEPMHLLPDGDASLRHPSTPGAPAATDTRGGSLDGLRILLVEDNEVNRAVASAMLRRCGAEVVPAIDGHEALALVATTPVDLVLMDLQMPGLDGIEATRRIRASEEARGAARLPIVAMTGNALEDYGEACEAAGMDAFVTKPVTVDQLRGVVQQTAVRA